MSSHWPVFLVGIFLLYSHEINQQGPQPSTFVFVFAFFSDTVWVWWWHCAQCHVQPHRLCVCLVFVGLMVAFLKTCICCSLIIQLPSICLSIMNALCYCTVSCPLKIQEFFPQLSAELTVQWDFYVLQSVSLKIFWSCLLKCGKVFFRQPSSQLWL